MLYTLLTILYLLGLPFFVSFRVEKTTPIDVTTPPIRETHAAARYPNATSLGMSESDRVTFFTWQDEAQTTSYLGYSTQPDFDPAEVFFISELPNLLGYTLSFGNWWGAEQAEIQISGSYDGRTSNSSSYFERQDNGYAPVPFTGGLLDGTSTYDVHYYESRWSWDQTRERLTFDKNPSTAIYEYTDQDGSVSVRETYVYQNKAFVLTESIDLTQNN